MIGKTVARRTYLHLSCLPEADVELEARLTEAEKVAGVSRLVDYNLVRIDPSASQFALLNYPGFFDEPFPALRESRRVDLTTGEVGYRTYEDSLNPPIPHRKELLLPEDHPRRAECAALTRAAEAIGLFDEPARIGYRRQWEQLVREKGYRIVGHELVPLGNDETTEDGAGEEQAPSHAGWQAFRHLTALVRFGFSAPVQTLARYGFLDGSHGVFDSGCGGGDDVRGLVENGIEAQGWGPYYAPENGVAPADIVNLGFVVNVIEDFDQRLDALTRAWSLAERLLVVSVMLANQNDVQGQRFRDGVLTRRGTFQKYYTQAELKAYLEAVLDEEPIPVAPGVLYVFRDKDAEQRFLVDRYRSRRNRLRSPSAGVRERPTPSRRDRAAEKYETYREPLDRLWERCFTLGRKPNKSEVEDLIALTEGFGSLGRALRFIEGRRDLAEVERSRETRIADLVEIHIGSGKVSLMRYDAFEGKALPRMVERVKIKLREQDIDYFAYGEEYEPPFPYRKSRCINEEFPNYPEQVAFEEGVEGLELFDFSGYGPRPGELLRTLERNRLAINGFELVRATTTPEPDDPCGQYLTFRQLIECGETQARTSIPNLPKRPESYNALHDLAVQVLDPVIDYFGIIRLTYGFCSPALAKEIPGRIDPKRDQHAAHELNRLGNLVCPRLGAAVDFIVEDENMLEVAQWVVDNTPFDRLYLYGDDEPIHVSFGPEHSRQVVRMVAGKSGRLVPRVTPQEHFARTHHYDFRLEKDGVFKSWVLRKLIPQVAGVRRLAIAVEDHDLSFGDFEGEIPQGEYGAGRITIWDRGTYSPSNWGDDRITFEVFGDRLAGTYSLTRFVRAGPNRWLLFKHKD